MDKRANKRIKIHQLARVCGKMGVMNNISIDGLEVSTSVLPENRKIDVCFEVFGEEITVWGVVQWFRRKTSIKNLNELGVVIKEAPPQYYRYVNSLV
ncbi:MAG TPA: hypothetical protein VK186_20480 [Candidatus Deferrimicrobium sp.]|nr:hypothetical protein [Candidatus Deferrimicrobium sp.]